MKKIYIFLVLVFVLGFASLAQAAQFEVNLSYGSTNSAEVVKLQAFLQSKGYLNLAPTGKYYTVTKNAVSDFQLANGLRPADGIFGPATRAVANAQSTSAPSNVPATVRVQSVSLNSSNGAAAVLSTSKTVNWQTTNYPSGAGVDINLIRKTTDTPSRFVFVRKVVVNTANDGQELFTLRTGENGSDMYVEVTCSSTFSFTSGCQLQGNPMRVN